MTVGRNLVPVVVCDSTMSRNNRKRSEQYCVVQETTLGRYVIGRTGYDTGMRKCDQGFFDPIYDDENGGELAGFVLRASKQAERAADSDNSPCAIPASEMQIYAGRHFKEGKSQTARMKNDELARLTRIHPKFGWPLPPEDRIERIVGKVKDWPTTFSISAGKVSTKRPKRLVGMKHPMSAFKDRHLDGDVYVLSDSVR